MSNGTKAFMAASAAVAASTLQIVIIIILLFIVIFVPLFTLAGLGSAVANYIEGPFICIAAEISKFVGAESVAEGLESLCKTQSRESDTAGGTYAGYGNTTPYQMQKGYTVKSDCSNLSNVPSEFIAWIQEAADKYLDGDQAKLAAVIEKESSWQTDAISDTGAVGLGQFIASTALDRKEFGNNIFRPEDRNGPLLKGTKKTYTLTPEDKNTFRQKHPEDERLNARKSIMATAEYLAYCLGARNGDFHKAYAEKYNGESGDRKYENADRVIGAYNNLINSEQCTTEKVPIGGPYEVGCNYVPLIKQNDPEWKGYSYAGCGTIGSAGCGITSISMVLNYYGEYVNPTMLTLNEYRACGEGCTNCQGTNFFAFEDTAEKYGLEHRYTENFNEARRYLEKGIPVIASMGSEEKIEGCDFPFTENSGHFIVLTCDQGDQMAVNDPAGYNTTLAPTQEVDDCSKCFHILWDEEKTPA